MSKRSDPEEVARLLEEETEFKVAKMEKVFQKSFLLKNELKSPRRREEEGGRREKEGGRREEGGISREEKEGGGGKGGVRREGEGGRGGWREEGGRDIMQAMRKTERREEEKRRFDGLSFWDWRFWRYQMGRHTEMISNLFLDLNLLLVTFPLNTIKTRVQSKHKFEDVAFFMKNKVDKQSVYAGMSQGFLSCLIGTITQTTILRLATIELTNSEKTKHYNNFTISMLSHLAADFCASTLRLPFEVRKQILQVNAGNNTDLRSYFSKTRSSFMPTLLRDLSFRVSYNVFYYLLLFKHYYYFKFFGMEVPEGLESVKMTQKVVTQDEHFTAMFFAMMIGLFISNPFDVVATKLITQQYGKYRGMWETFGTVVKEEGAWKLMFSGYSARSMAYAVNVTVVYHFYDRLRGVMDEAYAI